MVDCIFITSTDSKTVKLSVYPYLGVGYLASVLMNNGFTVKIYDVDANNLSQTDILNMLHADKPRFIGLSIMARSLPFFYKLVPLIRSNVPDSLIFAGGSHVTSDPEIISDLGIEYGLRGDGETTIVELLKGIMTKSLNHDLPGLVICRDNKVKYNDSCVLNELNLDVDPAYELFDINAYADIVYPGVKSFSMDTSRGCPYNCSFCSNHSKTKVRMYSLETVYRQIDTLVNKYGVKWIAIVDDLFTFNKERVINICNYIIENNIKFKWSCLTRVDKIDEELLVVMKKAGLYNIIFGVESGSDKIRAKDNKKISNDRYREVIKLCRMHGIRTLNTYIIGHPGETKKQMFQTIMYSIKLSSTLTHYQLMSPLPASPVFEQAVLENKFSADAWTKYMKGEIKEPFYFPDSISLFDVKIFHFLAYLFYYLLPHKFLLIGYKTVRILLYKLIVKLKFRK